MQPSALDAAEAAGIFISHDKPTVVVCQGFNALGDGLKMRPTEELDKANANGLA